MDPSKLKLRDLRVSHTLLSVTIDMSSTSRFLGDFSFIILIGLGSSGNWNRVCVCFYQNKRIINKGYPERRGESRVKKCHVKTMLTRRNEKYIKETHRMYRLDRTRRKKDEGRS